MILDIIIGGVSGGVVAASYYHDYDEDVLVILTIPLFIACVVAGIILGFAGYLFFNYLAVIIENSEQSKNSALLIAAHTSILLSNELTELEKVELKRLKNSLILGKISLEEFNLYVDKMM